MPAIFDEALVRALYMRPQPQTVINSVVQNPVPPLTYGAAYMLDDLRFDTRKDWLTGYGLDNNAQVLVVGSAFGYMMRYLHDAGITDVWGIDPGPWYWDAANDSDWATGMKALTANDWIGSGTEQASLDALPGVPNNEQFGWILDEDAAPAHSDTKLPTFISALEDRLQGNAKGRIVHIVTPLQVEQGPGDSSQNWKPLADWKAVAPDHTWVDNRGNVA